MQLAGSGISISAAALREQAGCEGGHSIAEAICAQLEQQLRSELDDLALLVKMLENANDPAVTMLPDDDYAHQEDLLHRLARTTYETETGELGDE